MARIAQAGSSTDVAAQAELHALATRSTVLVVDDEASIRELLAVILEVEGHRVVTAASAAEALRVLGGDSVDLITLDVMMPDMDGWQLAEQLDADPRTAVVPRVMISGKPLEELQAAPGAARAAAVLTKPFDFAQVCALVQQLLAPSAQVPAPRAAAGSDGGAPVRQARRAGAVRPGAS